METRTTSVLLVDDDPANLSTLEAVLEPLGQRLVLADSGREALRCVLEEDFAVILLDVRLGDMSGLEVMEMLRERERNWRTPILLMTAADIAVPELLEGYAHGAVDYLSKPLIPQVLRAKVATFVELQLAREQVRRQQEAQRVLERSQWEAEQSGRLHALLLQAPVAVAITRGPDFILEFANAFYEKVMGRPVELGQPLLTLFPELEAQPGLLESLRRVLETGEPFFGNEFPVTLNRGEGGAPEEAYFDFIYQAARDPTGLITGVISISVEVTGHVRARLRSERLAEELHSRTEALRESEERLRLAVESTALGTWDLNPLTRVLSWDARCKALVGVPPETQPDLELFFTKVHPEDRERVLAAMRRAMDPTGDGHYDVEYRHAERREDAEWWMRATGRVHFEQGRAVRFTGTVQDISERKHAERERGRLLDEARQRAEQLRGLTEASLAINAVEGLMPALSLIAERARALGGAQRCTVSLTDGHEGVESITALSLADPSLARRGDESWSEEAGLAARVRDSNQPLRLTQEELRGRSPLPPPRGWLAVPLVGRDGANLGLLQLSDKERGDFTAEDEAIVMQLAQMASVAVEKIRLYELARTQRRNLFAALMQMPEPLAVLRGPDFRFEMANLTFSRSVGGRPLEGRPIREAMPELEGQGLFETLEHVYHQGEAVLRKEVVVRWRCSPETFLREGIFNLALQPLRDGEGRVEGIIAVAFAVTEQVLSRREIEALAEQLSLSEQRLITLAVDLEDRVHERTAQLQAVNQELESFSYSVSHDLRAPLRHIIGFAQLLERRAGSVLDEVSRGHLKTITTAARDGGTLIDDLLEFSRMGRAALRQSRVDLGELVREVLRGLEPDMKGRSLEWRIGQLPAVKADPVLVRQVLRNLLANALKYTRPRAHALIEVGARDAQGEVEVWVRDNGVGFDMRYADKLFGVFQRLHTVEQFEGTGIGLANVRRIISRHGGRTWAEGAVDQGATFHFTLPRAAS
ncbi:Phytochrome, two-component sensor histidine kinase [Cystobacter fuscus DSM 2262]|uniref:histidine kinase n=1 Tax=Cystobacter fuscus (strain ATCC 25194 / DSM 2262 / NBRC 100088 / M29) TaxID=1242864 RepID=S9PL18_CYSF2|nr:ATP-binding protein [Cystobacter fuscus]EPX63701.1 Phytochrome, two-component sensor histidine kinase [Cystobacter fuscus DSM 2262]